MNTPMAIYDQGAAGEVGLPDWPVVRVEVVPELPGPHRAFRAVQVADRGAFRDSAGPRSPFRRSGPQDRVRSQDPETGSGSKRTARRYLSIRTL
jgi:hypothetical protein